MVRVTNITNLRFEQKIYGLDASNTTRITPSFPMRNYLTNPFLSLAQNKYLIPVPTERNSLSLIVDKKDVIAW